MKKSIIFVAYFVLTIFLLNAQNKKDLIAGMDSLKAVLLSVEQEKANLNEQLRIQGEQSTSKISQLSKQLLIQDSIEKSLLAQIQELKNSSPGKNSLIQSSWNNSSPWVMQSGNHDGWLNSVYFVDENTGYAVGSWVVKTIDGGITWVNQIEISKNAFRPNMKAVAFVDANTGYAVGSEKEGNKEMKILKTTDGGQNWISINTDFVDCPEFTSVSFVNADTGYIVGEQGCIIKTTDGGKNWILQGRRELGYLGFVKFFNVNNGFILTASGIIKTTDGGINWSENLIPTDVLDETTSCYFINNKIGFVAGEKEIPDDNNGTNGVYGVSYEPRILKTTDGGKNWITLNYPGVGGRINSIYFCNENTGYVVADHGLISKTTDGGKSWKKLHSGTTEELVSVFFTDLKTGYVVGDNGVILKTFSAGE